MLKKIEKIASFLTVSALIGLLALMMMPDMARSDAVTAWASVSSMYTCSFTGTALAFGSVDNTVVYPTTASTTVTITANSVVYLQSYDAGNGVNPGLYGATTTNTNIIGSANDAFAASATLVAGTEGFGIRAATTTAGSGNTLNLSFRYGTSNQVVGSYYVGGLAYGSANDVAVASTSAGVTTSRVADISYYVAVGAGTAAGDYTDTITYTCTTTP